MRFRRFVLWVSSAGLFGYKARYILMRAAGMRIGRSRIAPRCYFAGDVKIGTSTYINRECFFDGSAPIQIGNRCAFGMRAVVATSSHILGPPERRASTSRYRQPVIIGDGCWIGAGAMILPGVTIGEGCVIAAGAIVTHNCEANGLYAGVPAERKKDLDQTAPTRSVPLSASAVPA